MKKLIISLLALMLCVCLLFVGCKGKDDADTTTTTENTTAATEDVATTQEPTSEVSTEESTFEESTDAPAVQAPPVTNKQPVKVTEPKVETNKKIDSYSWNTDGTYKCGNGDGYLVPGEYYIVKTGSSCTVSLTNGKGSGISRAIENDTLVTLKTDYTVTIKGGKIIHVSKASPSANSNGVYVTGIYKVGRDIPAGEYVARKNSSAPYAAGITFRKSTDYFSGESLDMRTVDTPTYITLEAGEYVEIVQGNLSPATNKSIAKENSDGSYSSGMYKVGVDIPAGKYMLTPITSNAMYNIYKDSLYTSSSILKTGTGLKNTVEIKLQSGQYIEFTGAKIIMAVDGLEPSTAETSSEEASTAAAE